MEALKAKWDERYRARQPGEADPAWVLREYAHLLPAGGAALDLACGLGDNAIYLARRGLRVTAWDISPVAIGKLAEYAAREGLAIDAAVRDVEAEPPPPLRFDVIVVSHFLHRPGLPALAAALRPGGLLYYQTWTVDKRPDGPGPSDPRFLLRPNELLRAFCHLRLRAYREEGRCGDATRGVRDIAALVAQREEALP